MHSLGDKMAPVEEFQMVCAVCQEVFKEDNFEDLMFMESCGHQVCKPCLKETVKLSYPDTKCPCDNCDMKIFDAEIRIAMGDKDYDDFMVKLASKALEGDKNVVKCKCGNLIELVQGKVYYDIKNDEGKVINKPAAKHMSQYRVRCPECEKNFCSSCGEEPYHLGKTCIQHQKDKEAKKCRFCGGVLKSKRSATCGKKECANQARKCCKKDLPCSHPCYGYTNETVHPPCLHEECVAKDE